MGFSYTLETRLGGDTRYVRERRNVGRVLADLQCDRRADRAVLISGPIVFTAVGFILRADGLGVLRIHINGEGLRLLAELTLAMVLWRSR